MSAPAGIHNYFFQYGRYMYVLSLGISEKNYSKKRGLFAPEALGIHRTRGRPIVLEKLRE